MSQEQRDQDCRHEVRKYLAQRMSLAFSAESIRQKLNYRENDFTEEEVRDALVFLVDLEEAKVTPDSLGSTEYFQITSKGKLAQERKQ